MTRWMSDGKSGECGGGKRSEYWIEQDFLTIIWAWLTQEMIR